MTLNLTNTLSAKKEPFSPLTEGVVRMYHCGPTVKDAINIDKFRSYLLADILRRYFEYQSLEVQQVMNITDVGHLNAFEEDAIEIEAARSGKQAWELIQEEEKEFHDHRHALRILDAHHYPRARENIPEFLDLVGKLLDAGVAYRSGENIYFDVHRFSDFGKLAHKSLEELEKLQEEQGTPSHKEKRHALDIDLWRTDILHSMHWPSPWGRGFPGWHLECTVMSRKYLGETFDIHTGSEENIFPHHECEIAQAEVLEGHPLAQYWLHSAHVLVAGKPCSKANRNLITCRGLLESGFSGVEVRLSLLNEHYRSPMEFTPDLVEAAQGELARLRSAENRLGSLDDAASASTIAELDAFQSEFEAALDDDLDYPNALKVVLRMADAVASGSLPAAPEVAERLNKFDHVLGLLG